MKPFLDESFLLPNQTAETLYSMAKDLPILDYHCHLDAKELYEDRPFADLADAWLSHDHYKWRFMRWCGVPEEQITGNASGYDKFLAYAKVLYLGIGNPLYHWSHLELKRYFGFDGVLNEETADHVWQQSNRAIFDNGITPRALVLRSNVKVICTTDDPASTLEFHQKIKEDPAFLVSVLPTFRPDRALYIQKPGYSDYIQELGQISGVPITSYAALLAALEQRIRAFRNLGCVLSDHSLEFLDFSPCSDTMAHVIFSETLAGKTITDQEARMFFTHLFLKLAALYRKHGLTMQLHIGALRNNNTKRFETLGPDAGFDSPNDFPVAQDLMATFNTLEQDGSLPQSVLYPLNPKDYLALSGVAGNFQSSEARGKIQLGTAWWFNDHKDGMLEQLKLLADTGALGTFVGMLTDSRSFLSYTRHEYFRRILCAFLGTLVENGEYPNDETTLRKLIEGICYKNALHYFNFEVNEDGNDISLVRGN